MQDTITTTTTLYACPFCGDGVAAGEGTRIPTTITVAHTLCLNHYLED